ncbi:MAG TPA: hypothetical protein VFM61_08020 [Pseudidiomarina sp.]|nr:hypothetical protein [Pseudidiomarina sp.]
MSNTRQMSIGTMVILSSLCWSSVSFAEDSEVGSTILSQLRLQELQERSAASRAKQVQYELQVAQAEHAIDRLQQPQASANPDPEVAGLDRVVLIGWTERQGKLRFLFRVNERIVRAWEGIRDQSGLLATQINEHVQVSLGAQTYQLEIDDAQGQ